MGLLIFKPGRDARHRAACLALYRSLLRLTTRVPLPAYLATSGPLRHPSSPTGQNPLRALVTRHFTHNRPLVSPRLITAALTQGYRSLTLLTRESTSGPSPRLLTFLRANAARLTSHYAARAALHAKYAPGKDLVPLITKVSSNPPVYAPTAPPRPVAEGKVRWIPTFDDCEGIPFLRMRGRQSFVLSAMLNRKLRKRRERLMLMEGLAEEGVPAAEEEDEWDWLVEGGGEVAGKWRREAEEGSWRREAEEGVQVVSGLLQEEYTDMVARSHGYWEVLEQERRAARGERMVRKRMMKEGTIGSGGEGGTGAGGTAEGGAEVVRRGRRGRAYERKR